MTVSTNAQICYGVTFDEDFEFPWDDEKYEEIDDWWLHEVHGFKPSVELFGPDGEYLNGIEPSKEDVSRYFGEQRDFLKAHPLPVGLVNYCSCDYPMIILAVPRTVITARRGYPSAFNPFDLTVALEEREALLKFLSDHGLDQLQNPAWILSSLWC